MPNYITSLITLFQMGVLVFTVNNLGGLEAFSPLLLKISLPPFIVGLVFCSIYFFLFYALNEYFENQYIDLHKSFRNNFWYRVTLALHEIGTRLALLEIFRRGLIALAQFF